MKKLFVAFFVLSALIISSFQNAKAEDAEKESRTVFTKLVKAAKAKNTAEFKSYMEIREAPE